MKVSPNNIRRFSKVLNTFMLDHGVSPEEMPIESLSYIRQFYDWLDGHFHEMHDHAFLEAARLNPEWSELNDAEREQRMMDAWLKYRKKFLYGDEP